MKKKNQISPIKSQMSLLFLQSALHWEAFYFLWRRISSRFSTLTTQKPYTYIHMCYSSTEAPRGYYEILRPVIRLVTTTSHAIIHYTTAVPLNRDHIGGEEKILKEKKVLISYYLFADFLGFGLYTYRGRGKESIRRLAEAR
jgi:hypothetical protein